MHAISVKELRTKFPFVRSELKKGTTFLIIHKSKPIGQLKPLEENSIEEKDEESEMWERAAMEDWAKHLPPLTQAELNYYDSLPPYKE